MGAVIAIPLITIVLITVGYVLWTVYLVIVDTITVAKPSHSHGSGETAAHYDLAHSPIEHTVSALLLVWDGAQLLADEAGDLSATLGSPGVRLPLARGRSRRDGCRVIHVSAPEPVDTAAHHHARA